jgi:hypothetical protein
MKRICVLAVIVVAGWLPRAVRAEVVRYAMIIGNDAGDSDEQRLRYAEDDAQRMYEVLRELGGFRPENMLMLRSEDAETMRRGLISLNDRIRTQTVSGAQSELLVYYSGHSDQEALHLGRSPMELVQLEQLVRGSAATLRMLILDSCRSGALTRVKGGTIQPGLEIALDQQFPSDGVVFWTATSESENAQESDTLKGSFFTHYLVSGLLGAADRDGNGSVTLGEAYQYAYENTLRATSRTLSGTQHPTFHYELGGHGDVVLTVLDRHGDQRALISFPEGKSYLLINDGADGAVVAEVGAHDRNRRLSVKPGRYFVRGRDPEFLLEGTLVLRPAEQHQVREQELERIDYTALARKGRVEPRHASSVQAGYALQTPLWSGGRLCQGPFVGYALDLGLVDLGPRVGVCRGSFVDTSHAHTDELDIELDGVHVWHSGPLSVGAGLSLGGTYLRQDSGDGTTPARHGLAHVGVVTAASVELARGFYSGIDVEGMAYFRALPPRSIAPPNGESGIGNGSGTGGGMMRVSTPFALRFSILLIGKHW